MNCIYDKSDMTKYMFGQFCNHEFCSYFMGHFKNSSIYKIPSDSLRISEYLSICTESRCKYMWSQFWLTPGLTSVSSKKFFRLRSPSLKASRLVDSEFCGTRTIGALMSTLRLINVPCSCTSCIFRKNQKVKGLNRNFGILRGKLEVKWFSMAQLTEYVALIHFVFSRYSRRLPYYALRFERLLCSCCRCRD